MLRDISILLPFLVAFTWTIIISVKSKNKEYLYKQFFIFFICIASLNYLIQTFFFNFNSNLYAMFDSIWNFTSLSIYPLYYYYTRLLTKDTKLNYKLLVITLIPAFTISIFSAIIYILMTPEEINIFINSYLYNFPDFTDTNYILVKLQILKTIIFKVVFILQSIIYLVLSLISISQYHNAILNYYSNIDDKKIKHVKWVTLTIILTIIIGGVSNFIGKERVITNEILTIGLSLAQAALLHAISYAGYKQDFSITDFKLDLKNIGNNIEVNYNINLYNTNLLSNLCNNILKLLEEKQLFKYSDICLGDICKLLGTNRFYVSIIIKVELNTNFNNLINSYRIDYAKRQLFANKNEEINIDKILLDSGFSNRKGFFTAFKKHEGINIAEWLNKQYIYIENF